MTADQAIDPAHLDPVAAAEAADPILPEIVRRLVAAVDPERIYLFGSRARGDARADSDYDLLVVTRPDTGHRREVVRQAYDALWGLGVPKDIVVVPSDWFEWMRSAAASLPATVEREGRLLYAA
ncbi:MAG: nucleotidyltransferase domain-containing protein [Chloroflexota bacterium]